MYRKSSSTLQLEVAFDEVWLCLDLQSLIIVHLVSMLHDISEQHTYVQHCQVMDKYRKDFIAKYPYLHGRSVKSSVLFHYKAQLLL
ncbi:Serine/threonine-protein kinase [Actinidia chinensis var. chinensis]|uniref:Serine/threonine-protein kinase n=1 Tax=Actinidia chinensis var. chinensis TaxID=1590841 RepID=A0A2R6S2R5_ACTCC|nr:Serine/threonine-protein kinase [Actinidia chinensis var. chinensis]